MMNRSTVYSNMHFKSMIRGISNATTLKNHNAEIPNRGDLNISRDCTYYKSARLPALINRAGCYSRGFVLHIDVRSVTNLMTKWLGWHKSNAKAIQSTADLVSLQASSPQTMTLMNYTNIVKRKIMLLKYHTAFKPLRNTLSPQDTDIRVPFCNRTLEALDLRTLANGSLLDSHIEALSTLLMNQYTDKKR
jgi:hypothetical protein